VGDQVRYLFAMAWRPRPGRLVAACCRGADIGPERVVGNSHSDMLRVWWRRPIAYGGDSCGGG